MPPKYISEWWMVKNDRHAAKQLLWRTGQSATYHMNECISLTTGKRVSIIASRGGRHHINYRLIDMSDHLKHMIQIKLHFQKRIRTRTKIDRRGVHHV